MKQSNLTLLFIAFIFLVSCEESKSQLKTPYQIEQDNEEMFPRGAYPVPIIEIVSDEEKVKMEEELGGAYTRVHTEFTPEIIKSWHQAADLNRISKTKAENNKSYATITHGIWHYQMAYRGYMRDPKFVAGRWINFLDDLTYEYGKYDVLSGKGKYIYSLSENKLILVDDNDKVKPSEFEVARSGDDLVLHGTAAYEDQRVSAKFIKDMTHPVKK